MKKLLFINLLLSTANILMSQVSLTSIPDSLLRNVEAVVLNNDELLEIEANNNIVKTTTTEILVLTNKKNTVNEIMVGYDQFTKIEDLFISIFTTDGKKIKTIKKKDFLDQAAYDGFTIASDDRFLYYKIVESKLPYILKKQIRTKSTQSFNIPGYSPYEGECVAVLKSTFTIINHDINNPLRFQETILGKPNIDSTTTFHRYNWTFNNITAAKLKSEKETNIDYSIKPVLENFQMDGIAGSLKNWQTFGIWLSKLNEGMDALSENVKQEVIQVIGEEKDKKEIVKKLYRHLQENMRYVSIQLGIGGYKPMSAQAVHEYKYGDCKALSNYMKAILNVAGITSKYVIINAGKKAISPDPLDARNIFNHAILAVPFEKDTMFLECTSNEAYPGYQGTFTGNRLALLVDGEHSGLVKTTQYDHTNNEINNRFDIFIQTEAPAEIIHHQILKGIGTEFHAMHFTKQLSIEKFRNYLLDRMYKDIFSMTVNFRKDSALHGLPLMEWSSGFKTERKVLKSGDRYFIETDLINNSNDIIYELDKLKDRCHIMHGITLVDRLNIKIPVGCHFEKIVKNSHSEYDAGEVNVLIDAENPSNLNLIRKIVFKKGEYRISEKGSIKDLIDEVKRVKTDKIVIQCKS